VQRALDLFGDPVRQRGFADAGVAPEHDRDACSRSALEQPLAELPVDGFQMVHVQSLSSVLRAFET
jgi:hypothetical protein